MNRRVIPFAAAALCVAALGALPFLRAWDYGIVALDDYVYVLGHVPVRTWLGWESVIHHFTDVTEGIWMPLTWFSYSFDHWVFGEWFGGYHLHAICIHGLNAALLWVYLLIVFGPYRERNPRAPVAAATLLAALVWAVHPLRCESVVYVASRKDVLSFFWEALALILWARGTRSRRRADTAASVVCFVLGSMCKPSVMTFPLLCLLVDAFAFRSVRPSRYAVPAAYMLFVGGFAAWQQAVGRPADDMFTLPLLARLQGACAAFGIYLRNSVWPQDLALQCLRTWPRPPRFLLPGVCLSVLCGGWLYMRTAAHVRRWRAGADDSRLDYPLVGIGWFALAVAPMLGIANFGYHAFADRFTYVPAVGLSVLVAWGTMELSARWNAVAALLPSAAAALALAGAAWRQTGFWRDDRTLFTHTLEVDGDQNACAHGILANWYFEYPHDLGKCAAEFEKMLRYDPKYALPNYWVYIVALGELGREAQIAERMRTLSELIDVRVGPGRSREFWTNEGVLGEEEQHLRSLYWACKVAWWLTDEKSLDSAQKVLERLVGPAQDEAPCWVYLRWQCHLKRGNVREAARLRDRLRELSKGTAYVKFGYLFGGGER